MSHSANQISKIRPLAERWRFIQTPEFSTGAANMALDQSMACSVAKCLVPPTLRVYGWRTRTISIGRFQAVSEIDLDAAKQQGLEVVRRPTGGRALLHADEVTYSIAVPRDHNVAAGGVLQTYKRISQGLVAALKILGIHAEMLEPRRRKTGSRTAACFETPSAFEITVGGKKLIGSAQCTRDGYVLQHGSIPLTGSQSDLVRYLDLTDTARRDLGILLASNSTSLALLAGNSSIQRGNIDRTNVTGAIAKGLCEVLNADFADSSLELGELETADLLIEQKYANDVWTSQA